MTLFQSAMTAGKQYLNRMGIIVDANKTNTMNYIITINQIEKRDCQSKDKAVAYAKKLYDSGNIDVGILKKRTNKGKLIYTHLPLYYYV